METRSVYILSTRGEDLQTGEAATIAGLLFKNKPEELKLNIQICNEKPIRHLTTNYDAYILHFSDVKETQINELREEQPGSWIYLLGVQPKYAHLEMKKIIDVFIDLFNPEEAKQIGKQIMGERT